MILKVEDFRMSHLEFFPGVNPVDLQFCLSHPLFRKAYSLMNEAGVVGILGYSYISKGVLEGWFHKNELTRKYAKSVVKTVREFSDWMLENDPNMHRLQMAVLDHNRKWAEALGFQFEGIVKNYHSNKDHFMYVKVRGYGR